MKNLNLTNIEIGVLLVSVQDKIKTATNESFIKELEKLEIKLLGMLDK